MAIAKLNPLFKDVHGKIGNLVFRRGPDGKTIISLAPKKSKGNSKKAQDDIKARNSRQQKLLDEAHNYARTAMADLEMQAYFQRLARKKHKSAYSLAFGHFFKVRRKLGE